MDERVESRVRLEPNVSTRFTRDPRARARGDHRGEVAVRERARPSTTSARISRGHDERDAPRARVCVDLIHSVLDSKTRSSSLKRDSHRIARCRRKRNRTRTKPR